MLNRSLLLLVLIAILGAVSAKAQVPSPAPDECFGFTFGKWNPSLKSASSTFSPGYDPTSSAPAGAPPSWATRAPTTGSSNAPADSVLLLFPPWWPAGVAIQWTGQHGDTLVGVARALVADARVRNPEASVRALHISCHPKEGAPRDTSVRGS